jgi:hypothetical protein
VPDACDESSLLWQQEVEVPAGAWRGRELVRDGRVLGFADRGVLFGDDGRWIAELSQRRRGDDGIKVHVVEDGDAREVGSLVPATRVNWRGKTKAAPGRTPLTWSGTVRFVGSSRDVAYVRGGAVVRVDGRVAAEVLLGEKRWWGKRSFWGDWTLRFHDCDDRRLRVVCFGWLKLAWDLQRAIDTESAAAG